MDASVGNGILTLSAKKEKLMILYESTVYKRSVTRSHGAKSLDNPAIDGLSNNYADSRVSVGNTSQQNDCWQLQVGLLSLSTEHGTRG